jgi:hypothetical protein
VPRAGGPTLRVATVDRQVALPDVTVFGLPRLTGTYAWSVRHFPTLKRIDDLGGEDVRVVPPSSVTAERTVVVR